MNLNVISFLREHSLADLCERYAITAKRHPEFPQLVFLKYDQTASPMAETIVQECRGLILDEADGWRVVSYPFRKFFNHGEPNAASVDWSTARVYEKLDGSLMTLYWYAGEWRVASNGTPDAGGHVNGAGFTFAELFWRTWKAHGYVDPCDWGCCYMFELMTPHNRVVVSHEHPRISFLGCRRLADSSFREERVEHAAEMGWESVRSYSLASIDACLAAADALDPMASEGYVVCDANFSRVKIKSPRYVALAHLKENCTPRRLLEIVRTNESDEFLAYFPEFRPAYEDVRAQFGALCAEVDADYARLAGIPDQKAFAIEAVKTRCSSPLFSIRKGRHRDARAFFADCTATMAERVMGLAPARVDGGDVEGVRNG